MKSLRGFAGRLRDWTLQFLVSVDQLGHVWCAGWFYVWLGRGACPNADETISSWVGRKAAKGRPWALVVEMLIDALFRLVGQRNHCRRHIEQGPWDEPPLGGRGQDAGS